MVSTMRSLIYIVAIDDASSKVSVNDYFCYSRPTWEYYCDKYDIDLIVSDVHQLDGSIKPIWNKEMISVIGRPYDKIGIVDCDTMIRWDAPNIFDLFGADDMCAVSDLCDLRWMFDSIDQRQRFFPNVSIDPMNYVNAGVLFFGKRYLQLFGDLLDFYLDNRVEIDSLQSGGREQTLLNFIFAKNEVNIKKLSPAWNLLSMHRKNVFVYNWQLNRDRTPHFIKYAYLWHFTGFPIEQRIDVMKQTWELSKHLYA